MKNKKLPHILAVQGFDSEDAPIQFAPPLDLRGLSHFRARVLPHLLFFRIQCWKGPHSPHPPSTPARYSKYCFSFYILLYCCLMLNKNSQQALNSVQILPRLLYFVCAADIGDDFTSSLWLSVSFLISTFAEFPEKRLNRLMGRN